jgi:alpha-beta hydrolase superfamily lysophospholipase
MIHKNTFTIKARDLTDIYVTNWEGEKEPTGIIQIAHGMAEHIERYDQFARKLVEKGYYVFGNDHRGHGKTGQASQLMGYFSEENGFSKVVDDLFALTNVIKEKYTDIPIILFGHSMGSFLMRRYVQLYGNEVDGLILSGTGGDPGILGKIGKWIAQREIKKHGQKFPSMKMNTLIFGSYNKKFKPARTKFDWLSRDDAEVDKYIQDPLCGFLCTAGFFYDLLDGLIQIHALENIRNTPSELPILLVSGDMDPVGKYGKDIPKVFHLYQRAGVKDISIKLYPNARHELLNEINREEVMDDIIHWLDIHFKERGAGYD